MSESFSTSRIIGHYQGQEPGPLIIAIGGVHGNEPAGVRALEQLFELLEEEPHINPGFTFSGEILALRGNIAALNRGVRFIDHDLNRIFQQDRINRLRAGVKTPFQEIELTSEEEELLDILATIEIAVNESEATEITILDLHTTTATGGIFSITADDIDSLQLGSELYGPVIKGMLKGLDGTSLHYFQAGRFGPDRKIKAITFEAGQHDDPESVNRALAATINLLRAEGCVQPVDVRTLHDETLRKYAAGLPNMTELVYIHQIAAGDEFEMKPGYVNFQRIEKGEELAKDKSGAIYAPLSGYILMPLYQKLGKEGFFLIKDAELNIAY